RKRLRAVQLRPRGRRKGHALGRHGQGSHRGRLVPHGRAHTQPDGQCDQPRRPADPGEGRENSRRQRQQNGRLVSIMAQQSKTTRKGKYIVASDVGGTCTDTIVFAEGEPVRLGKALSTPPNFAEGVLNSARNAADSMGITLEELFADTQLFVHGSTVVDNTVLTRDGSLTGLVTTAGFEDTLLVTRGAYGRWAGLPDDRVKHPVATDRAPALVPADLIQGVPERVDYRGAGLREIDEAATEKALRHLIESKKVEAIAVCFLWSFYNPVHAKRVRQMVQRIAPQVFVPLSSEISPVPGEYERTSTAVI